MANNYIEFCTIDVVEILAEKFGTENNSKGYKVLNNVRVIQGDEIDHNDVSNILEKLKQLGYSATNIAFGMGGGLIQKNLDRDTHKFAFKCSSAIVNNKEVSVSKSPVGDESKRSKEGKLELECGDLITASPPNKMIGGSKTYPVTTIKREKLTGNSLLNTVYENGQITSFITLDEVRENTKLYYISK